MPKPRCSYQLHIQLQDIKPAIWRRIVVADHTNLEQLHRIIQVTMGWENAHLYAFEIAGQRYGMPDPDWPDDRTMDARRYTVGQLLQGQAIAMRYTYDFGDDWQHRIKLEACEPAGAQQLEALPQCLAGRNACPPEDCGGPFGYQDLVCNIDNAKQSKRAAALTWEHADFDAKHFDLATAQSQLQALRPMLQKKAPLPQQEEALAV